jgi:flagellar biogenesis protein FliO
VGNVLAATSGALPVIGDAMAWLVPAVWVAWGLGLLALIDLTFAGTWLMRRLGSALRTGPQAA